MRSHYCGLVTEAQLGQTVSLCGWVNRRRDHGGVIFVDLRDREGYVQVVCDPDRVDAYRAADRVREAVVLAADGLSEEELRRPGVPSGTNLLGIVHHLTGVEQHWLQRVFLGSETPADRAMAAPHNLTCDQVIADYGRAWESSNEIVETCGNLSTPAAIPNPGEQQRDSLRVILTHLIEETARHAGHADILREMIDGATAD